MIYLSDLQPLFFSVIPNAPLAPQSGFCAERHSPLQVTDPAERDPFPLQILTDDYDRDSRELASVRVRYADTSLQWDDVSLVWERLGSGNNGAARIPVSVADTTWYFEQELSAAACPFRVEITYGGQTRTSQPLMYSPCETLKEETVLIRYAHHTNVTPYNAAFNINGTTLWHYLRVRGGVNPDGFKPLLDDEDYRNQRQEIQHLYGAAYARHTLTLGDSTGLPYYYADLLNRILTLSEVHILLPGETAYREIRRSSSATPELSETYSGSNMYHITQEIEFIQPTINL